METLLTAALLLLPPSALAQLVPNQPSTPTQVPAVQVPVENVQPENTQSETENLGASLEAQLACGPNQFPSAFSDVYPTDWAYQAVNRLASRSMECFNYPSDRLLER